MFSLNQKVKVKNYPDPKAIPNGSVGRIIEICNNKAVIENFNQPMYLVTFNNKKLEVAGFGGSWLLESELENND